MAKDEATARLRAYAIIGARVRLQELDAERAALVEEFPEAYSEADEGITAGRTRVIYEAPPTKPTTKPRTNGKAKSSKPKRGAAITAIEQFIRENSPTTLDRIASALGYADRAKRNVLLATLGVLKKRSKVRSPRQGHYEIVL